MSNEQNPFADPNPFAVSFYHLKTIKNWMKSDWLWKIKDPSIQRATVNVQQTQQSLDDYNPFSQQNTQTVTWWFFFFLTFSRFIKYPRF